MLSAPVYKYPPPDTITQTDGPYFIANGRSSFVGAKERGQLNLELESRQDSKVSNASTRPWRTKHKRGDGVKDEELPASKRIEAVKSRKGVATKIRKRTPSVPIPSTAQAEIAKIMSQRNKPVRQELVRRILPATAPVPSNAGIPSMPKHGSLMSNRVEHPPASPVHSTSFSHPPISINDCTDVGQRYDSDRREVKPSMSGDLPSATDQTAAAPVPYSTTSTDKTAPYGAPRSLLWLVR